MVGGFDIALWALLVIATITDLRWGKIFNATTFPFFILGVGVRFLHFGSEAGFQSLLAIGIAFVLFFPLYLLKTVAAADVKLLMAVGAWTEPRIILSLALVSILFGALVGMIVMTRQLGIQDSAKNIAEHLKQYAPKQSTKMPFAPAFLCAFIVLKIAETYQWSVF